MVTIADLLPSSQGLLPYYMILVSLISVGNSAQCLLTLHYTRRIYCNKFVTNTSLAPKSALRDPEDSVHKLVLATNRAAAGNATDQVTPLAARLFATWTLLAAVVRMYAAYHLEHAHMYDLVLWTYVVALGHFLSEMLVFKTVKFGAPDLVLWTYVVALGHFLSEMLVFKTVKFGAPSVSPLIVATTAMIWMPMQRGYYVRLP
ncbi:Ergosterol biosynthetic protein 28 like [Verticillium longisporum]|uniref:Ergosterol biosynthetic protein 28 like n=1 Tax=Verticillium longisporum TaxID=100787 RepID=A0A8I2Z797_VERLO|nr:Ergosterol biosynthetic protein 28 like [Verticillium longisporum]